MLMRVDFENRLQSAKEELMFKESVHQRVRQIFNCLKLKFFCVFVVKFLHFKIAVGEKNKTKFHSIANHRDQKLKRNGN